MNGLSLKNVEPDEQLTRQLIDIRRHLHQNPELSFQEYGTSLYIRQTLEAWGISSQPMGETGVIVDIVGEQGEGLHIGIRADIDALPIFEQTGLPYASRKKGVMHACGHDGHTSILLGTVYQLYQLKNRIRGRVRCIFQPGEEADGAAKQMIEQGVLDNPNVDCMLALHLWPHLPFGTVGIRMGIMTAACDDFTIQITGRSGHSARPQQAIDAIMIGSQIIQALSNLVTKGANPLDPIVIHVGKVQGGTASNVVADCFHMEGTVRTISGLTRQDMKAKLIQLVESMAKAYGGTATVDFRDGHPAVTNDQWVTSCVKHGAIDLLGGEAVFELSEPSMGADDFGFFSEQVPSCYFRLGINSSSQPCFDLHHPQFNFDERIIPIGVKIFSWTILSRLLKGEKR